MRRILPLAFAIVLSAYIGAMGQGMTTSFLNGTVKDKNGAVPGANIVAVHEPTGTTYGTVSGTDGKFAISNMRVGGPYKVTVSFIGYVTQSYTDITLKLGEPYVLNHEMKEEGTQLDELVVTGSAEKTLNAERNGAVTNISSRQLLTMPSITRTINDMFRMTPQGSSYNPGSMGGGNYRQNNFTIDGADFNNSFGIGGNLPGNGNPISLDALEEVSINVTPYDIRQSGFIGSAMSAVTRSGSNTFTGSVYYYFRSEAQQGTKVQDETPFPVQRLDSKTMGFRVGGPIIKNKLFFFANYESLDEIRPGQTNVASTPGAPYGSSPNIARPDASVLDGYSATLNSKYGYETGPYQGYDFKTTNQKITARIDWNINPNHRLNVRYSQVENITPFFASTSRSPLGGFPQTRTSIFALQYKNANYYQENNLYSFAAELNSTFGGGKFANTLRATYTDQNEPRSSDSSPFPFVDILDGSVPASSTTAYGTPYTSFGYEPFTFGNLRQVRTFSFVDNLSWNSGKHGFTVGAQADFTSTKNGFQRFGTSYFTFASWNDFDTNQAPRDWAMTYSLLPGYEQAFPTVKTSQFSVYGQDEYTVNDRLKITAGLRIDLPMFNETKEIQTHPLVAGLSFEDGRKIDTGVLPDSKLLFSPRVGFNFDLKGDRSVVLRGGTGIFTGRIPMVWIVSQSGDAGLIQFTETVVGQANMATRANGAITGFNPDPNFYRPTTQPTPGTAIPSTVSALTKDFNFPQTWKSSLAVDVKLPWGIIGSVEAILNKDLNVAKGMNPNLATATPLAVAGYPDTRPIHPVNNNVKFLNPLTSAGQPVASGSPGTLSPFNPVVLVNAQQGHYASLTLKLEKALAQGLWASVAYTKTDQQVLFDGSGDQLLNTWSITQIVGNANTPEVSYSSFLIPDRWIGSLTYRKEYLKHLATGISLFYEGSIAGRFSYTYSQDFNRDGQFNDLIYIPKDASEITFVPVTYSGVTYTPQQQSDMFFAYVAQDEYLSKHMGEYAQRNGAEMPWRSQVDFRLTQDVFTNLGGRNNTLTFTWDIFNIGNLINPQWGVYKSINSSAILVPSGTLATPGGTARPTFQLQQFGGAPIAQTFRNNNSYSSTYYMQFGLRYTF